ncbi:MAG: hypothetical protein HY369_01265 [Candidatus Aenigmarchaeota archaeon]|nr:hypothetical protein [Candidatus Aenigmarchaeota archaeon]
MGRSNPDLLVAGSGFTAEVWGLVCRKARKKGLPPQALHVIATPRGDELAEELAEAFVQIIERAWKAEEAKKTKN